MVLYCTLAPISAPNPAVPYTSAEKETTAYERKKQIKELFST